MAYGVRSIGIGAWLRYWRERLRKPEVEHELPGSTIAEDQEEAAIERERERRDEDAASSA
ncbi:MAG TPA: hypothetical protein VEZ14_00070 [Dehalococcoidia bacterium]|nr:hypothetical protein [Dehalococcoidia bacterium]